MTEAETRASRLLKDLQRRMRSKNTNKCDELFPESETYSDRGRGGFLLQLERFDDGTKRFIKQTGGFFTISCKISDVDGVGRGEVLPRQLQLPK